MPGRRLARAALPALVGVVVAVAVFLALGGGRGADDVDVARAPAREGAPDGPALFARMGCGSCHAFSAARSLGGIAPDLDDALRRHDRASLAAAIVRPPGSSGFVGMPRDFGERMTGEELDTLVRWMLREAGSGAP